MRRILVAVALAALLAPAPGLAGDKGDELTVNGLNVKLLSKPDYLSKSVATLLRGTVVRAEGGEKKGFRAVVSETGQKGWIHGKYLAEGRVKLSAKAGGEANYVAPTEYAHAARGFNEKIEQEYKGKNENLEPSFKEVDKIQAVTLDSDRARSFAEAGKLGGGK